MIEDYSFHGKRHIKKDYHGRTFSNPYFNRKQKPLTTFNIKLYIQILTALFLLYVIIYSDLFKVRTVEVTGTDMINPAEIQQLIENNINHSRWLIFPGRNLIFVSAKKIKADINAKYSLSKLEVNKKWQKISVSVEERVAYLIVNNGRSYYFIDAGGLVTKELTAEDLMKYQGKFPELFINQDLKIGDSPISSRAVNYIIELDKALKAANLKVAKYESGGADQINVYMATGWKALFSINNPLNISMENLSLAMAKKLQGKKFDYVDLRFSDRVIYSP